MLSSGKNGSDLKILKISTIAITSVVLVEIILGLAVGSLAILGDGAHALLDASAMVVLLVTTRASLKPPDEEHMYGHEKIESIGGLIGGILLLATAIFLTAESVLRLVENRSYLVPEWEFAGFIAIAYTFSIDILRVRMLHKAESKGTTLKAGFYHALADLGSTLIALLGFGLATTGFYYGDALASLVLSAMINYLSVKLIWSSGMELTDTISRDVAEKVRKEILSAKAVRTCENLRVRKVGAKTYVEATVKTPEYVNLEEAHETVSRIEEKIRNSLGNAETTIHIEPLEAEMHTEKLVEKLTARIDGVKEVHEVNVAYTDGKLYITLHARLNPKLSVQKAHRIAEKIENILVERIKEVENVTVHIEPLDSKVQRGSEVDESEMREMIQNTLEDFPQALRCRKILTYVADKKRYINIDCSFTSQISIEEAHRIASQIEGSIRRQFAETIVTVHMEPG